MRNAILAGIGILAFGGAGALGLLGGDLGGDVGPGDVDPVAVAEVLRPAMLPGACPTAIATDAPKCKQQIETERGCICLTAQDVGTVDGEMTDASAQPAKDRVNLTVCCRGKAAEVLRLPAAVETPKDCRVIGQPVSDFTAGDMPTDYTRLMDAACAPCVGHDRCPACLCAPGGCAEACR
jgi:hypothetical protein